MNFRQKPKQQLSHDIRNERTGIRMVGILIFPENCGIEKYNGEEKNGYLGVALKIWKL